MKKSRSLLPLMMVRRDASKPVHKIANIDPSGTATASRTGSLGRRWKISAAVCVCPAQKLIGQVPWRPQGSHPCNPCTTTGANKKRRVSDVSMHQAGLKARRYGIVSRAYPMLHLRGLSTRPTNHGHETQGNARFVEIFIFEN